MGKYAHVKPIPIGDHAYWRGRQGVLLFESLRRGNSGFTESSKLSSKKTGGTLT